MHVSIHLDGNEGGGIRTVVELWYDGFCSKNIKVSFVVNRNGTYAKELKEKRRIVKCINIGPIQCLNIDCGPIRLPDIRGLVKSSMSIMKAESRTYLALKELNPDVIVGNNVMSIATIGSASKKLGIDFLLCLHAVSHPNDVLNLRKRLIAFYLNKYCKKVIGVSKATLYPIISYLTIPWEVIHNSIKKIEVDKKKRLQLRNKYKLSEDVIVYGCASRINRRKAIHRFVDAAMLLHKNKKQTAFLIAGSANKDEEKEYLIEIKEKIKKQEFIKYVGFLPINEFYSSIDVFCHTSDSDQIEPFGLTVFEALSAGLPIIVCDVGGFLEILPQNVGVRYRSKCYEDLTFAMKRMAALPERKRQSVLGEKYFEQKFDGFDKWIEKWIKVLRE